MTGTIKPMQASQEIRKRYLFFLRHFNDIDNIAPIIHGFLGADGTHQAEVLLYDENYSGRSDPNLNLLSTAFPDQFQWCWLGDRFGLSFESSRRAARLQQRLRKLLITVKRVTQSGRPRRTPAQPGVARTTPEASAEAGTGSRGRWSWLPMGLRSVADVRSGRAGADLIRKALTPLVASPRPADLVIFDVVRSHHVSGILKALRALGCRSIICLPVSPLINYNVLREYDFTTPGSQEFRNRHDYSGFDALSYVDGLYLEHYRSFMQGMGLPDGLPRDTNCIGSLRYAPEWIRIRSTATAREAADSAPQAARGHTHKRLLVLLSRLKANVNREELQACLDWLAQADGFEIRIKGHPRASGAEAGLQLHAMQDANSQDTSTLVDWCDAILFWGTSAALEGFAKGKTMICIPFVSSNLNLYVHYSVGFIARCRDEMVLGLRRYLQAEKIEPYNHSGIEALMREVVRAGHVDWNGQLQSTLRHLEHHERPLRTASESLVR
ncbi:MAG: hypothetical protein ACKO0M_09235 [Cyanobium sp.]